jgi:hypothetical protein
MTPIWDVNRAESEKVIGARTRSELMARADLVASIATDVRTDLAVARYVSR